MDDQGSCSFSNLFEETEFGDPTQLAGAASPDDLFTILENLESAQYIFDETTVLVSPQVGSTGSASFSTIAPQESEAETSHDHKRQKLSEPPSSTEEAAITNNPDGLQRISHITVERNRRKHMTDHLSILRSLVPCFYIKRGDQASIIGGVVDYIKELQQILQSLEAKKQRKVYSEVLSPRLVLSNPRKPPLPSPLSPRLSLPVSPRTPQPGYLSPTTMATNRHEPALSSFSSSLDNGKEVGGNSKSAIAEVDVKFSGSNVLLKTISPRIPGQAVKIVAALEGLAFEILHVSISTVDETMLNSFTIKIGIECELSAEELANEIQQTFC